MTPLNPTRRSAERFADLVDRSLGDAGGPTISGGAEVGADRATADLLVLVGALRAVPEAQPRPEFTTGLRDRLMAAAETELAPVPAGARADGPQADGVEQRLTVRRRTHRPRERRMAVALGAFAIVGSTASMAVASQNALPGDALYPLKRVIETTQAHLTPSDQGKGTRYLHSAGDRLAEVQALTQDGGGDADQVTPTLEAFSKELSQGADLLMQDYRDHGHPDSIGTLRRFDEASMLTLKALDGNVPPASQPALVDAAEQLFTIDAAAGQLCPGCSDAGITEIPATLLASDTGAVVGSTTASPAPGATTGPTDGPGSPGLPTAGPTTGPTTGPTSRPTTVPTGGPTRGATNGPSSGHASSAGSTSARPSPTGVVSSIVSALTQTAHPTQLPTVLPTTLPTSLPTGLPSGLPSGLGPGVSGLATAAAASVGQLISGVGSGR